MALISLKCPNCAGDIELDDSRKFGFCMYCGSKVMIARDVNNISVEMSVKDQRASLKPLATAFCQRGEFSKAEEITKKLIAANAADADIWRIDGACELLKSDYPFANPSGQAIRSLEYSCLLSGIDYGKDFIESISIDLFLPLAKKGDV
jgi:DNA-directed RNA polymerase subunit RPC12/RpoP